ncbi:hypothetical protein GCM10027187_21340 [Streptosporangium sandarakinum]
MSWSSAPGRPGWRPYIPHYPGIRDFGGEQLHTAGYRGPEPFRGRRVLVVGGGNSAAQILAEVSTVAQTTWVTLRPPRLLPDEIDGRALFDLATRRHRAIQAGQNAASIGDLGDIVAVAPVRQARDRGVLKAEPMFSALTADGVVWADGSTAACDVIVWCTGFRPALGHLAPLRPRAPGGAIPTDGTRAVAEPRLAPARLRRLDRPGLGHPDRRGPHGPATGRGDHHPALPGVSHHTGISLR